RRSLEERYGQRERRFLSDQRDTAVLAPLSRSQPHSGAAARSGSADAHAGVGVLLVMRKRSSVNRSASSTSPSASACSSGVRGAPLSCLSRSDPVVPKMTLPARQN